MDPAQTPNRFRFPHSLVLIFGMIIVAYLATLVIPAGTYDRETKNGKEQVVAGSYKAIERETLPFHTPFTAVLKGMEKGADIIAFVFIVGGIIAIIRATGAIDAGLMALTRTFQNTPSALVVVMLTVFAVGSSTIGMAEEYMPLIPILVATCLALRFDAMVAMAIVYVGAGVGYGCAALNPFTIVIAKNISEQNLATGSVHRWILLAILLAVGSVHIILYARRVRNDPKQSHLLGIDYSKGFELREDVPFNSARVLIILLIVAMIGIFVWGAQQQEWYLAELTGLFLALGVLVSFVGRLGVNRTAETFCAGAAEMTTTALLIGFARTIQVILDDAQVTDTIVHGVAQSLEHLGAQGAAVGMLGFQSLTNFFIPSGSGQAYVTMPLMTPIADLTKVGRETAIFAYQMGDGLTNMVVPTNALLMGMLALARIPYSRWLRFILPLLLEIYVVCVVFLMLSAGDGWF